MGPPCPRRSMTQTYSHRTPSMSTGPHPDIETTVRLLRPDDVRGFAELLAREGESLGGSSAPIVFRAVGNDAAFDRGSLITVAVVDGEIVGAMVSLIGGSPTYWKRFLLHHPVAGSELLLRRVRKRLRSAVQRWGKPSPHAEVAMTALPEDLLSEPRLQMPPPQGATVATTYRATGEHLAYGPLVVVASEHRGRRIAQQLHGLAFEELSRRGVTSYMNSFLLNYEPSIRLYLRLGFTIYRFPFGFFGTYNIQRDCDSSQPGGLR